MTTLVERFRGFLKAGAVVDPGLPIEKIPFVVVDTELTGLDMKRDSVISVGAIKMAGTRIELGRSFYRLVSPRADFKHESIVVHGITPDDVAAQAAARRRGRRTARLLRGPHPGRPLLQHRPRLSRARGARREGRRPAPPRGGHRPHPPWVEQQRQRHAGGYTVPEGALNLVALALSHGIRVGGAHNALTDAFITAQLLQRQLRALPALGVRTLGDLLRIGKP